MSEGTKFDTDKSPLDLIDHQSLTAVANVFGFGAKKYGRFNFKNGIKYSRLIAAAYRHLGAFNSGEDLDPESLHNHIAHLGCCVLMLLEMQRRHPNLDDRYKPEATTLKEEAPSSWSDQVKIISKN